MSEKLGSRLQHAWNSFLSRDSTNPYQYQSLGQSSNYRPDRLRMTINNERSIIAAIYTRIAIDVAATSIQHVRVDQNGRYLETINSGLNNCFTLEANADQTGRECVQDIVMSMFDEGCIALVPVDTTTDPTVFGSWDLQSMRVAKIIEWFPQYVRVRVYNESTGNKEDITLPKKQVVIIENPLYAVMNEPNGTLKRLIRKLNLLDAIDEQSGSGKLDLIIQLPYVIKTPAKKDQAELRRKDIEMQLTGSKYGIAYTDGTERITQLNRPVENNLMAQITYLTNLVFSQLGMTEAIFDGTADEKTLLNYHNRTVEPILSSITDNTKRKWLTKTARSQNQSIMFFRDPFKLVPLTSLSDIADSFTRNAILSSNEMRSVIGYKPSSDPDADKLLNKNVAASNQMQPKAQPDNPGGNMEGEIKK